MRSLFALILCLLLATAIAAQEETQTPYEIALHRIEEARVTGATILGLSGLGLTDLPPEIGSLSNLELLFLNDNLLNSLPPEIGNLSNLQLLVLNNNQLSSVPHEFSRLENLQELHLSNNRFSSLPLEIVNLPYLGWLFIDGNPLDAIPQEVIDQGTPAILEYLRNEAWWHLQRLILGGTAFVGIITLSILGLRWRNNRRKGKRKNE